VHSHPRPPGRFHGILAVLAAGALLAGCSSGLTPARSPKAEGWYQRAQKEFKEGDFEHAHDSAASALTMVPEDPEVKTLAAEIALTSLDYAEVMRLLKGVKTTDAARLRGRALWYKGDLAAAADELETMLADPEVKDDWAKATSKLARRGEGRSPFTLSGSMLAFVEMVHVSPVAPYFVVPVEIDGESALAMLATGSAEVVLDSATRPEPSWVSLRFGERFEVGDVPALAQDLSGISKEIGAPIKALLGVNLLRHINATFDFSGRQFVARNFVPPPPPAATRLDLHYVRGGGMVVRSTFGGEHGREAALLVDTSKPWAIALDAEGWKKAGIEVSQLKPIQGDPEQKAREGTVPLLRLGAFDIPRVNGLFGVPLTDLEKVMNVDLDGVAGSGLLFPYRCSFADGGRLLWIEDDAAVERMLSPAAPPAPAAPVNQAQQPPGPAPAPAPTPHAPPGPRKRP
jgi:hypothetical protein